MNASANFFMRRYASSFRGPDYSLQWPLVSNDLVVSATIPGLSTCDVVSLVVKADRPATANGLYMLCSIPSGDGSTFTDLAYSGRGYATPAGVAQNTYGAGFAGAYADKIWMDGETPYIIGAKFHRLHQQELFSLYCNGAFVANTGYAGQSNRDFTDTLIIGNTNGYRWPGTIYSLDLWLGDIPDAQITSLTTL